MNVNCAEYAKMKICVALSGGKDSMALMHYLNAVAANYGLGLCAVNCDHGIRGEASARDSAFVRQWCHANGVPLICFKANGFQSEADARRWRYECYYRAADHFHADAVATAHHLNDNAETVLFHLARGSALSGVTGIGDCDVRVVLNDGAPRAEWVKIIRPMIACSRTQIDEYIASNGIPYVTDETNLTDNYTRNYIRHNVLASLENAVPGAAKSIYRFSRLAKEDDDYLQLVAERDYLRERSDCCIILFCDERVLFRRAVVAAVKGVYEKKDYTAEQIETLYRLQFLPNGKTFEFLGLTAYKENGRIAVCPSPQQVRLCVPFSRYADDMFGNIPLVIGDGSMPADDKTLRFDGAKIPGSAVIRTRRAGDRFTKFGGGTKSLGDYFTDKKIPLRLRGVIPLIADGSDILAVCGVEISDKIRVDEATQSVREIYCPLTI